ncbi:hypothetical protein [Insolitispirillum peregrinum]|nr:hypothetical protein [Insolitispirillum peregrinum]
MMKTSTSNQPSPQAVSEDVTRITGHLPNLDLEIIRRDDPERGAEMVTITMRAYPGFDAVARDILPALGNPALLWAQMAPGALPGILTGACPGQSAPMASMMNPFALWQQMGEQVMQSWMQAGMGLWSGQNNPFLRMMMDAAGAPLCSAGERKR